MPLSDVRANALLDQLFGGVAPTLPATLWVGLSTTLPTDVGGNVSEPVGNGYARVQTPRNQTTWPAAASRSVANGVVVTYPQPTGSWGSPGWFVVYDAATAGAFVGWGALRSTQLIDASSAPPSFAVGALTATVAV